MTSTGVFQYDWMKDPWPMGKGGIWSCYEVQNLSIWWPVKSPVLYISVHNTHIHTYIFIYIYIYIDILSKERLIQTYVYMYIHIHVNVLFHMYAYLWKNQSGNERHQSFTQIRFFETSKLWNWWWILISLHVSTRSFFFPAFIQINPLGGKVTPGFFFRNCHELWPVNPT